MSDDFTYDLFVSYSNADRAWVEGYLLDALTQVGIRCCSESAFALGVPRLLEFERAIQQSRRVLLILSPAYFTEGFTQITDLLAQSYGLETATWPVIPLIRQPIELPPRLRMLSALDASNPTDWPKIVERLCTELQRPVPGMAPTPPCPYPGMIPFSEIDSDRFFGREDEIQELLESLRLHPFLTVIGPSGSGKTSLVFAGLVPALRQSGLFGHGEWLVCALRPGETPLAALADVLDGELDDLAQTVFDLLGTQPVARRLLLIVDQFEELFTQSREQEVEPFQQKLLHLAQATNCYLLLTVRADFYPDLMASSLWPEVRAHRMEVLPLDRKGLYEAIVKPAEGVGVFVEPTLVERLVADATGEPGILPLLQETLVLLWERLERRFLPLNAYEASDGTWRTGMQVAIARRADTSLAALRSNQKALAQRIFLRLVQFGEGRVDTRRQQPVTALQSAGDTPRLFYQTLSHLVDNRLLTVSHGEQERNDKQVDIAHEALITGWPTLQRWLDDRREAEQVRRQLEAKAAEWVRLGRSSGGLLDEIELLEAEEWMGSSDALGLGHSETLSALVEASQTAKKARSKQKRRTARFQRGALGAIALLILAALIAIVIGQSRLARQERNAAATAQVYAAEQKELAEAESTARAQAERQTQIALSSLSRQLATQALSNLDENLDLALLLSLEAHRLADTYEARNSLFTALRRSPHVSSFLHGHPTGFVSSVAFSPDGKMLASGSWDHTIILWDTQSRRPLGQPLTGHEGGILTVQFSPDGKTLASGSNDNSIILWNVGADQPIGQPLEGHTGWVRSVAFSPDGQTLASSDADGTIILWNVNDHQPIGQPLTHTEQVNSVAFSPDGQTLASGSNDNSIILWNVGTGQPIGQPLEGHTDSVMSIAFSPDGDALASASSDKTVRLWDVASGQLLGEPLTDHAEKVVTVAFSPDGQLLASGGGDEKNEVILWDVETGQSKGEPFVGHVDAVVSVAFSPDGQTLASGGVDNRLILWDVSVKQPIDQTLTGHSSNVQEVAFSPDGHTLASCSDGGRVVLWNVETGESVGELIPYEDTEAGFSMSFSPDDRVLATGSCLRAEDNSCSEGLIYLWDIDTLQPLDQPFTSSVPAFFALAFSPDGQTLASGGYDGTITLWDVSTGQALGDPLVGHTDIIVSMDFSPDGKILASSGIIDGNVMLWDIATGKPIGEPLTNDAKIVMGIAFSPDGKTLAVGSCGRRTPDEMKCDFQQGEVHLWDVKTQRRVQTLAGHVDVVGSVAFSPDGQLLASDSCLKTSVDATCLSGEIRLWDVATGRLHQVIRGHPFSFVTTVAFSPDGGILASGSADQFAILWDISFDSWRTRACRIANRNLTQTEWDQFVGPETPYQRTCPGLPLGEGVSLDALADSSTPSASESTSIPETTAQGSPASTSAPMPTYGPTPTPRAVVSQGMWQTEVYKMPTELSLEFPSVIQCRESVDSDQLVDDFVGVWAVRSLREDEWVSYGSAQVILASDSGVELNQYKMNFQLTAEGLGWLIPIHNAKGYVLQGQESKTPTFKLVFDQVEWSPVTETITEYPHEISLITHEIYGNVDYPQHRVSFRIQNLGDKTMSLVRCFGIVQDQMGNTVDVLRMSSNHLVQDLSPNESIMLEVESFSKSGRCVGRADPEGYTLNYWLAFQTEGRQLMTRYYSTTVE